MTELISRQAALAEIDKNREALLQSGMTGAEHILVHYGRRVIEELPTIDVPDRKVGKWSKIEGCNTVQCSECLDDFDYIDGLCYLCHGQELPNYCPNCGARMGGDDWEEPEINPCRGCDDYDGRGGCKSNGGCGAEREAVRTRTGTRNLMTRRLRRGWKNDLQSMGVP